SPARRVNVVQRLRAWPVYRPRAAVAPIDEVGETGLPIRRGGVGGGKREGSRLAADAAARPRDGRSRRDVCRRDDDLALPEAAVIVRHREGDGVRAVVVRREAEIL